MKLKSLLNTTWVSLLFVIASGSAKGQIITYTDTFKNGATYCMGSSQYDGWGTFRNKLDTTLLQFKKVTAKGTFNNTGYVCTDAYITRKLAIALKNGTVYSATCDGNNWGVWGAGVCKSTGCSGSSSNQVELTVNGSSCSCGSKVSFNTCIENFNWGTVDGGNCSPPTQRMTLQFEAASDLAYTALKIGNGSGIYCSGTPYTATVTVKNIGPGSASQALFKIYSPNEVFGTYNIGLNNLPVGKDTTFTLASQIKTNRVGTYKITLVNNTIDVNKSNDTTKITATIVRSPYGGDISPDGPYNGKVSLGLVGFPDITTANKTVSYQIAQPGNYTNASYGTTWVISNVSTTVKGYPIPSSFFTFTAPSASSNGKFTAKFPTLYEDSLVVIKYRLISLTTGCDSIATRVVRIVAEPHPNFGFPQPVCDGTAVVFDNKSTIKSGNNTYMWYFGDGDSSDNINAIHTYKTYGSYKVKLVVTSVPYGIVRDTSLTLQISEIPTVSFKPTNACEGVAVKFTNLTTVSAGTLTYDWDFGDNTTHSVANSPSHLYASPGGYKVTLSATANGCTGVLTKNAYEFARPKAGFTAPVASICAGTAVVLPNTSTIVIGEAGSYWNFGDGVYSTALTGVHAYAVENTYNVKLKMVSEFGCTDSITKPVTIKPAPKVSFTTGKACSQTPSIFTNTTTYASGQNPSYTWSFSDGGTATTTNVTHPWTSLGPKTIVLSAIQANGCTGSSTQNIDVLVQPKATFKVSDICSGENAVFENQTTIDQGDLTYLWDFGDNNTTTTSDPLHPYTVVSTKTFNVVLIASAAAGCTDTARGVITVSQLPVCGFTTKVDWPNGYRAIKFTPDNSGYTNYTWSFGEGGSSTAVSPLYTYLYDGNFRVTLKAKNAAGCECETEIRVPVGRNQGVGSIDIAGEVNIYPNPNNGMFTVSVDDAASSDDGVDIEVYNTLGERIYTIHSTAVNNLVDLGGAARGIYIIKVKSKGKTTTRKVSVS